MRLLDPNLLTADIGKIMVRDNAIVFAMEHIRLIISATTVIIPRDGFEQNLLNSRFNALLEESIIEAAQDKAHREARVAQLREIAESDIEDDGASSGRQRHDSIFVTSAKSCIGLPSSTCQRPLLVYRPPPSCADCHLAILAEQTVPCNQVRKTFPVV